MGVKTDMETLFYLASNESGDVTGDADRKTAIDRLESQYGGENVTVSVLSVTVPRPAGYLEAIVVRDVIDDGYIHRV